LFLIALGIFKNITKPNLEADLYIVESSDIVEEVTAPGEVMAEKAVGLVFLQPGQIDEIYVSDGDVVAANEQIARVDTSKLYQSYLSANAALRSTQATLDRTYDDVQGHEDNESFAQREARTSAEAARDQTYRSLVVAQISLSEGIMRAPFAGIINYSDGTSIGSYASPAMPSFSLVDPETVYFESRVNELDISSISVNARAEITLDAYPDEVFGEQVKSVGFVKTITSSGSTAYKVKTTLPRNIHNKFRLGMSGDVSFIINKSEGVITVPISSVIEKDNETFVWVVGDGARVRKNSIKTGSSSFDEIEVLDGLAEGSVIVERPSSNIKEGDKVSSQNGVDTPGGFFGRFF